jgi:uncharacterized protein YegP (UPF0339 family)
MAGLFELFVDVTSHVRFRLTAPDGTVMAVSKAFDDKPAAVAGIAAVREYAGMGHITFARPTDRVTPRRVTGFRGYDTYQASRRLGLL